MRYFLFLVFTFVFSASAAVTDEPPIAKGTQVQVHAWDPVTKTFDIVMTEYEAQGPNYATVADLLAAIPGIDKKRAQRKPELLVGNEYTLDNQLNLQPVMKINKLREAHKKKSKAK